MKKLSGIILLLFLTLSSAFTLGAFGLEGGFNGYNFEHSFSHNNRGFAFLTYKPESLTGPFDFTFSLGAGSTSYGYGGFSVALAFDSWGKPLAFGKIPVTRMNLVWGYGMLFSFGTAYYYLNGDGNEKVFEILPRLLLGYRYIFPNKKLELNLMAYFEAGFFIDIIDGHWQEGIVKKGFGKTEYGFDWDIPAHLGFRYWFNGLR